MKVAAAAEFMPVATALGELAGRYADAVDAVSSAEAMKDAWVELTVGGWLGMGLETPDGPGMLELAEAARAWGAHLVPVPFITSMLSARWRGADERCAVTCAVPTPVGPLAPFADWPDVAIMDSEARGAPSLVRMAEEDFDFSLATGICDAASLLSPTQCGELATLWAAETIGGAQQVLDRATAYAKQRMTYGRLIGTYQGLSHLLVEMHRDTQYGWSAVVWAAQGGDDAVEAAAAAIALAADVIRGAIQAHGGIGFTWELGLHRHLRHAIQLAELTSGLCSGQVA